MVVVVVPLLLLVLLVPLVLLVLVLVMFTVRDLWGLSSPAEPTGAANPSALALASAFQQGPTVAVFADSCVFGTRHGRFYNLRVRATGVLILRTLLLGVPEFREAPA